MNMTFYTLVVIVFSLNFYIVTCVPTITTKTQNYTANVNDSVAFECIIRDTVAIDPNTVDWYFLEHDLHIARGRTIRVVPSSHYEVLMPEIHDDSGNYQLLHVSLAVKMISTYDQGHYQCKVNGTTSLVHSLTVIGAETPPTATNLSQAFNFTDCCVRENVTKTCLPVCSPYQGINSLGLLDVTVACAADLEKVLKCGTDGKNHAGCCKRQGVSSLCLDFCLGEIPDDLNDNHTICISQFRTIYACLEEGRVTLPGPPGSVSALSVDGSSISVRWKPPVQNPTLVTGYTVNYKLLNETAYMQRKVGPAMNMVTINQLKTGLVYQFYIIATALHGSSQRSELVEMAPINAPEPSLHFDYITDCCVKKKVKADCQKTFCNTKPMANLEPLSIYPCISDFDSILQCATGERDHSACCIRNNLPDHCVILCKGKTPTMAEFFTWDLSACLRNLDVIEGCVYEGFSTIPGVPERVRISEVTATSAIVEWDKNRVGANATSYSVGLRHPNDLIYKTTVVTQKKIVFNNLKPEHWYEVVVAASNDIGSSYRSPMSRFLTYGQLVTVRPPTTLAPSLTHNFTDCCVKAKVIPFCYPLCNYTTYPEVGLTIDPEYVDKCGPDILHIIACGADGRNHRACCAEQGITEKPCLDLCDYTPGAVIETDVACIKHTAEYGKCFREGVVTLPRHPDNVYVANITAHAVKLSWSSPSKGIPVQRYIVIYSKDRRKTWLEQSTTNTFFIVQDLDSSTLYAFAVVSVGPNNTRSAPSPVMELYTKTYGKCDFIQRNNKVAKVTTASGALVLNKTKINSMDDCRRECDDFPLEARYCIGYNNETVNGAPSCTLIPPVYKGQNVSVTLMDKSGSSYYERKCEKPSPPILINGTALPSWDAYWQTKEDCCNSSRVSANCRPHCLSGDFGLNPNLCSSSDFHTSLACASDGKDHTSCCRMGYIPEQCLTYCRGAPLPATPISALCLTYTDIYVSCFRTGADRLPSPPKSFRVVETSSTYIVVAWNRPDDNCNGESDSKKKCVYEISYWPSELSTPPVNRNTKTASKSNTFNITGLQPLGRYTVIIVSRNTYGSSLPAPKLDVITRTKNYVDIVIDQEPYGIVDSGTRVVLTCNVYGNPPPTVSWVFNNNQLSAGRQLILSSITKKNEGNYTCTADQNLGTPPDKKSVYLNVRYKPDIAKAEGDFQSPNRGLAATLRCEYYGHPTTVEWKKQYGSVFKIPDNRHVPVLQTDYESGLTLSKLKIFNVVDKDYGSYFCIGTNKFGTYQGLVTLKNDYPIPSTLPTIPPKSTNETVKDCCIAGQITGDCLDLCHTEVNLNLVVNNTDKYGKCLDHLEKYIGCASNGKDHTQCCTKAGITEFCLPFCNGQVPDINNPLMTDCIFASNKMIDCAEEGHHAIPSAPTQVMSKVKNDAIEISWSPPKQNPDKVGYYEVNYNYTGSVKSVEHSVEKTLHFYSFNDVKVNVTYQIWVVAANTYGKSHPAYSKSLFVRKTDMRPPAPIDVHAEMVGGDKIYLKWTEPNTTVPVTQYFVYYNEVGSKVINKKSTTNTSYVLTGLNPNSEYSIYVSAVNEMMSSLASAQIQVSTKPEERTSRQSSSNAVGLGIGLTVMFLVLIGVGIATFIFLRKKRIGKFAEAVSFENPQYGNSDNPIQISGLPSENASESRQFDYSPLHEESDTDHHAYSDLSKLSGKSDLAEAATLDVDQISFQPKH